MKRLCRFKELEIPLTGIWFSCEGIAWRHKRKRREREQLNKGDGEQSRGRHE